MGDFSLSFVGSGPPGRQPKEVLPNFVIHHWKCHRRWPFIYMAYGADDRPNPEKKFFCDKCVSAVWRKTSGTSGNIARHVAASHPSVLTSEAAEVILGEMPSANARLLGLIVEQNLPFSIVSSPRLGSLCKTSLDRKGLKAYALRMAEGVRQGIRPAVNACSEIAVVLDEWSDGRGMPFLDVKVHGASVVDGDITFQAWCLDHVPLEDKNAAGIAGVARRVLMDYGITDQVTFVVTDTTNVMPAAVSQLGKCWWPCWAHIFNLMLAKTVEFLRPVSLDCLFRLAAGLSRSWAWVKLTKHYDGVDVASFPTFCATRWYSLTRLVGHALRMKDDIQEFLAREKREVIEEERFREWDVLLAVLQTFANATASIESERFGTISRVYDWLSLIETQLIAAAVEWPLLAGAIEPSMSYRDKYLGPNGVNDPSTPGLILSQGAGVCLNDRVLVATLLNPGSAYTRSMSPGNQTRACALLRSGVEGLASEITTLEMAANSQEPEPGSPSRRRGGLRLAILTIDPRMVPPFQKLIDSSKLIIRRSSVREMISTSWAGGMPIVHSILRFSGWL
jgi:hypothetical protein